MLMGWVEIKQAGFTFYQCEALNDNLVIQAFSDRDAGNMALHTGDDPDQVITRRDFWLKALDLNLECLVAGNQVHGTRVAIVNEADRGSGARNFDGSILETDALITKTPGIVLAVFTADCLPVFIYDPITPAIAVAHAGWRGTLNGITGITLEKMGDKFGTNPRDCRIAIGPSIQGECFQVDQNLAERFGAVYPETITEDTSGSRVDLQAFVRADLERLGVNLNQIYDSKLCTSCRTDQFFSYRGSKGTVGRMMGIISLR